MRQAALFLALSFLAAAPARAQAVNPDVSNSQPDGSGNADPLAGAQKRLTMEVQAGAEHGCEKRASRHIPTGKATIQINYADKGKAASPGDAEPAGRDYTALYIMAAAAL